MTEVKPPEPQENPNNIIQEPLNQPFTNITNNIDNTNNINIKNNTENDKQKKIIYNDNQVISTFVIDFSKREKNKKLDELISDLKHFKEQNKIAKLKTGFKYYLYENLEKNLIELSFLVNKQIKEDRLHKLYLWYKNKRETFEDLKKISSKSYKEPDEFDDLDVLNEKEEEKKLNVEEENKIDINNNTLEDFYKHRNKDMLFKDMLEEYKRKHLTNPYVINEENNGGNKDKEAQNENNENSISIEKKMYKTLSMTSFKNFSNNAENSTFYSTKHRQNPFTLKKDLMKTQSFFNKAEGGITEKTFYSTYNKDTNTFFPPLNRETKFSYSFNRPVYNYYSMYAENKIIQSKMKNLAEKRSREEINKKMEKYGFNQAKYKESIITKYELRDIVNMYANMNDFNSPMLEKYKYKSIRDKKESNDNKINFGLSKMSNEKNEGRMKNNYFLEKKERLFDINRQMKRSQSSILVNHSSLGKTQKMETNKAKNIDINSKSILEKNKEDIKVIKMKLKEPKEKVKSKILKNYQHNLKIPSDVIPSLFFKNPFFRQKILYNNICGVNFKKEEKIKLGDTGEGEESESEYHNFYMSAYDFGNLRKIENYKKLNSKSNYSNRNAIKRPINENINKTFNLNKDNFLNFRKTMSSWKIDDFEKLSNKLIKNRDIKETTGKKNNIINDENRELYNRRKINLNLKRQNSLFNAMLNPFEDSCYPQYYLPRSGSMLMIRKGQNVKKGKKKKKKK